MPIHAGERPGLGGAAKLVADRARSIVRLELQLAATELKHKLAALGIGIGLLVGSALFGVFALGFLLATIAAAIATTVSWWLALLIVTAALFLFTGALAAVGVALLKRGVPPVPEHALEEMRRTAEALKNGH
jgi:membrane protein implicated in regulation of membrane protease activity